MAKKNVFNKIGNIGNILGLALQQVQQQQQRQRRIEQLQAFEIEKQQRSQLHSSAVSRESARLADARQLRRLEFEKTQKEADRRQRGRRINALNAQTALERERLKKTIARQKLKDTKEAFSLLKTSLKASEDNIKALMLSSEENKLQLMQQETSNIAAISAAMKEMLADEGVLGSAERLVAKGLTRDPVKSSLGRALGVGTDEFREAANFLNEAEAAGKTAAKTDQQLLQEQAIKVVESEAGGATGQPAPTLARPGSLRAVAASALGDIGSFIGQKRTRNLEEIERRKTENRAKVRAFRRKEALQDSLRQIGQDSIKGF